MDTYDSTPRSRALALLNEALATGIRGHNREAVKSAIEVLEDNGKSGLTDLHYKNLAVGKTLRDPDRPGLYMRRNKSGAIWIYHSKNGDLQFGTYPKMSVGEARREWQDMKDAERAGEDVTEAPVTLKKLCGRFVNEYGKGKKVVNGKETDEPNKRSWREDQRMFDYDLVPAMGDMDVLSITREDIEDVLADIIDRGSPRSAEKLLTATRSMFNHVLHQPKKNRWVKELQHNPCQHIKLKKRKTASVHMNDVQVRTFLRALPKSDIPQTYQDILLLQFQTVTRIGEVAGLRWDEMDLDESIWELPAARSKNKTAHRIMLSRQSVKLLKRRQKAAEDDAIVVFPAERSQGHVPGTLASRHLRENRKALGVPDGMGTHGLRHTGMTQLASLGCGRELRDRIANHKDSSVDSIYQHYEHDDEAKKWWQKWANRMDALAADKVVPISKGKAS